MRDSEKPKYLREHSKKHRKQFKTTLDQIDAAPDRWERARAVLERCPTKLELDHGRLRVIRACWSQPHIDRLPEHVKTPELWRRTAKCDDLVDRIENCIKGPEEPCEPFQDGDGHWRDRRRVAWWQTYSDAPFLAFGH